MGISTPAISSETSSAFSHTVERFFALPILAIAGIGMRRMMGYMVITFLIALIAFGLSLRFCCRVKTEDLLAVRI